MKVNKEVKNIIEKNPVALATICKGRPHVIAVAFVKVKENKIIITNNYMKKTVQNLKTCNKISLAVWNKKWHGYRIDGTSHYYSKGKWFDFVKNMKENRNENPKGAIVVDLNKINKLS